MIDTLVRLLPAAADHLPQLRQRFNLERYGLVTLHRPSNVDDPLMLQKILQTLDAISQDVPLILPLHPRTRNHITEQGLAGYGPLAGRNSQDLTRRSQKVGYSPTMGRQGRRADR